MAGGCEQSLKIGKVVSYQNHSRSLKIQVVRPCPNLPSAKRKQNDLSSHAKTTDGILSGQTVMRMASPWARIKEDR